MSVVKKEEKGKIIQPKKMGLLVENPVYKPFRYPWCYDAWLTQQRIHWLPEDCLLYTSPSPRDRTRSRMPSSA